MRHGSPVTDRTLGAMKHPWCRRAFFEFDKYIVHTYGLTDPVLARVRAPVRRPGHRKLGGYADQVLRVVRDTDERGPSMFRHATERGRTPRWMAENIDTIDAIAQKAYNRHVFSTNAMLALSDVPTIVPSVSHSLELSERGGRR